MPAPVGATVTISPCDLIHAPDWPDPEPGDWLVTWSERTERFGTAYRIVGARRVRSTVSPRRFALRCEVVGAVGAVTIPDDEQVYSIVWSSRDRRRAR
jgi:hypothetical protein